MMFEVDTRKIASLMFDKKLTVRTVAAIARLSPTTTSKVIRGKTKPIAKTIGKLAQALGVKGEELLKKENWRKVNELDKDADGFGV